MMSGRDRDMKKNEIREGDRETGGGVGQGEGVLVTVVLLYAWHSSTVQ